MSKYDAPFSIFISSWIIYTLHSFYGIINATGLDATVSRNDWSRLQENGHFSLELDAILNALTEKPRYKELVDQEVSRIDAHLLMKAVLFGIVHIYNSIVYII